GIVSIFFSSIDKKLVEKRTKEYLIEPVVISYCDGEGREENYLVGKIIVKTDKEIELNSKLTLKGTCYEIKKIAEEENAESTVSLFSLRIENCEIVNTTRKTNSEEEAKSAQRAAAKQRKIPPILSEKPRDGL